MPMKEDYGMIKALKQREWREEVRRETVRVD